LTDSFPVRETGDVELERFAGLAVALGVGFLVGLQREQSASEQGTPEHLSLGGVRTFPLAALLGGLAVLLAGRFGAWVVGAGFLTLLVPIGLAYADDVRQKRDRGVTSEVSLVLTYFLGCLASAEGVAGSEKERFLLTASLGVAVTALLSFKDPLHTLAARVSKKDLYATVKFGILALVVLPLLPNKDYGPLHALNPAKIGLFVVFIAGISFLGYLAVRILGTGKGLGVTGLIGGLASSTAVALSFSARAKREPSAARACALGIVLASTIMGIRLIAIVAVTNPSLVRLVAWPLGALTLSGLAGGALLYFKHQKEVLGAHSVNFSNPFEISSALKFGLLFSVIVVGAKAATQYWGETGSFLAALLAGTVDVDAISISISRLAPGELSPEKAAVAIFLAAASNTVVKAGIAVVLGGWSFAWRVVVAFGAMAAAGGVAAAVLLARA
jgi:uncharacterized membrane protein (DUF4010 family)